MSKRKPVLGIISLLISLSAIGYAVVFFIFDEIEPYQDSESSFVVAMGVLAELHVFLFQVGTASLVAALLAIGSFFRRERVLASVLSLAITIPILALAAVILFNTIEFR
ncbi:MAG: hypothetical protein KF685_13720 [Acidobacteria bacterium]|nr:hypothetical protein [Acidobacteriota bacterium]